MKLFQIVLSVFCVVLITGCEQQLPVSQTEKSSEFVSPEPHLQIRAVPGGPFDQLLYDAADLAWGGRLYDKWWSLQDGSMAPAPAATVDNQPLWPVFNTSKSGETTWRCKSCHGWDYRGGEGVYGERSSSYFTKIPGIIPITGGNQPTFSTPEEIYNFLHEGLVDNTTHAFGTLIDDDAAFYSLAKFIVTMQEEAVGNRAPQNFINDDTRLTTGVEAAGAIFYATLPGEGGCETCHGVDGKLLDFKDGNPATLPNEFVDSYARTNPWETLHKIRFGQPGSSPMMLGLHDYANLADQDIIQLSLDVVAHSQNGLVPSTTGFDFRVYQGGITGDIIEQTTLDLARGGLLYDKWWVGVDETLPLVIPPEILDVDHPLWTPAATNVIPKTGDTTWRCKSCHGWDYLGSDGVYGEAGGSYETGIKGFIGSSGTPPTLVEPVEIFDFLHDGTAAINHAFNGKVSDSDLYALTRFVLQMQQDATGLKSPADFIDMASKTVPGGSAGNGFAQYNLKPINGGCGDTCHGIDGKRIDFADDDPTTEPNEFIEDVALENPWEMLHTIRFGHPGSRMRGFVDHQSDSLGLQEAVDIVAYTQGGLARNFVRGGRLYDNWIAETGYDITTLASNPLWNMADPTLAPTLDAPGSWRCSLCHGWDYRGEPAFSHVNDLIEIKQLRDWKVNEVFGTLKSGYMAPAGAAGERINVHNFGEHLTDKDLWDLSAFALYGVVNTKQYLYSVGGQVRQGDSAQGFDIFSGLSDMTHNGMGFSCVGCHGADGAMLSSNIFDVANTEPWRFFHKTKFGAPGTAETPAMPGMLELMTAGDVPVENQDAANVQSYLQGQ